jgi:CBS domain-containing protein
MGNDGQRHDRSRTTFLRVRFRDKRKVGVPSVFCPRRLKSVDIAECGRCKHGHGLSFEVQDCALLMKCGWPRDALDLLSSGEAEDTALAGLVTKPLHSIAQDADLESTLAAFLRDGVDAAAVLDAAGRLVGILSASDLLRWYCGSRDAEARSTPSAPIAIERATAPRVREAMSHLVYTLDAGADIARAAAIMAYEGVHQIVVTGRDGLPIGMISSLDISRCVARRNGYVLSEGK